MKSGILLFAHGARDPLWARPFNEVAAQVRAAAPQMQVALCFLEFMPPTLIEAGQALVEAGCEQVSVVPLFLGAGGHVRKDLPVLMQSLAAQHPAVQWQLSPAIGEMPSVITALAQAVLGAALP